MRSEAAAVVPDRPSRTGQVDAEDRKNPKRAQEPPPCRSLSSLAILFHRWRPVRPGLSRCLPHPGGRSASSAAPVRSSLVSGLCEAAVSARAKCDNVRVAKIMGDRVEVSVDLAGSGRRVTPDASASDVTPRPPASLVEERLLPVKADREALNDTSTVRTFASGAKLMLYHVVCPDMSLRRRLSSRSRMWGRTRP